jgi:hypothetical protein
LIATPATLAPQIDKLKQRFGLEHVVLAGDRGSPKSPADFSGCPDRGMIRPRSGLMCREASAALTGARLSEDVKPAGLDWITALRGPAIKDLLNSGALQLTLFDQRDMASSTAPDDPGERLVVCRNPDLAAERARKREDLLAATGKDLIRIQTAVERKRNPLCGTAEIALAAGAVLNTFSFPSSSIPRAARAEPWPASPARSPPGRQPAGSMSCAQACPRRGSVMPTPYEATNPWPGWSARSAASRRSICMSGRSITGWRTGCGRMSFCACWPTIWNGTCVRAWRRCCSMTPARRRLTPCAAVWWRRHSVPRPRSTSRPPA